MKFGLSKIDVSPLSATGAPMPLLDLAGEPLVNSKGKTPTLFLLGMDSDTYRVVSRKAIKQRLNAAAANKDKPKKEDDATDASEALADAIAVFVAMTVGWADFEDETGKPIEFTKEAALDLYTQYPVVRDQADAFMAKRANFIKPSSGK